MDRKENRARRFHEIEKGATAAPFFDGRGQLTASCRPSSSRPWLSSPLSLIPPFMWVWLARVHRDVLVAAAWHAHPRVTRRFGALPCRASGGAAEGLSWLSLPTGGFSS